MRVLDAAAAKKLRGSRTLDLSGLRSLDATTAKALVTGAGHNFINLSWIRSLDAETARALAGGQARLDLSGLRFLDATTATALAGGALSFLDLSGLDALDADTAAALTSAIKRRPGDGDRFTLDIRGIDSLEPAAADALVKGLDCRRCHTDASVPDLFRSSCRGYSDPRGPLKNVLYVRSIKVEPVP
jgi:anti-anti-sigma regulatory factor